MLPPGTRAPEVFGPILHCPGVRDGNFQLSSHASEVICLAIVSHTCPHCENEMRALQNLWTKYQGHGVQMVALATSDVEADVVNWLCTSLPRGGIRVTFPVLRYLYWTDYAGTDLGVPQIYIIGRNQLIHYSYAGPESETVIEGHILEAIHERDPVDLEMIMDVSDSMNSLPLVGDKNLVLMKQATNRVIDFLTRHGQPNDRIGLVWFSDHASEYTDLAGRRLIPVRANSPSLLAQITLHRTGICTAMGAGLQTAFNTLQADGGPIRFSILLTDGMQNIDPNVVKVGAHYEIHDDRDSYHCGAHSGTTGYPGRDIAMYRTMVSTIGIGITATYTRLLQDLANVMGGIFLGTHAPERDLDLIYFVDLCNFLAGASPAIVCYHAGVFHPDKCQALEKFRLNRTVRKITVILSWQKSVEGSLAFWLRTPDGKILNLYREMKLSDSYAMATVYLPAEQDGVQHPYIGEWQIIVHGVTPGQAPYHAMVIAEDSGTHFRATIPNTSYEVGDIVPLLIQLKDSDTIAVNPTEIVLEKSVLRVPVAQMLAQYPVGPSEIWEKAGIRGKEFRPDPVALKLRMLSEDPQFEKLLIPQRTVSSLKEGTLEWRTAADGIIAPVLLRDPGLNTFRIEVMVDSKENGPISRVTMVSVHVGTGMANPGLTTVRVMPRSATKVPGARIVVTPISANGHLLGPGMAEDIQIMLGNEKCPCTVHDPLDGSYQVEFDLPTKVPEEGQLVVLIFQGKKIWDGIVT